MREAKVVCTAAKDERVHIGSHLTRTNTACNAPGSRDGVRANLLTYGALERVIVVVGLSFKKKLIAADLAGPQVLFTNH